MEGRIGAKERGALIFVWVIAYGGIYLLGEFLSAWIGVAHSATCVALLVYAAAFVFWSVKRGDGIARYGLQACPFCRKEGELPRRERARSCTVFLFLLLLFPVCNLFLLKNTWNIPFLVLTVGVCTVEELFFRGYLFRAFPKNKMAGALVSSGVFALLHLANMATPSATLSLFDVLLQVISAFGVGIGLCGMTTVWDSLLPATFLHIFINATGVGIPLSRFWQPLAVLACSAVYALYGSIILYVDKRRGEKE